MRPTLLAMSSKTAVLEVHLTSSVNSSLLLYSHLQLVEKVQGPKMVAKSSKAAAHEVHLTSSVNSSVLI